MKINWSMVAVVIGLILNFAGVAYWGGQTGEKLESLDAAVTAEMAQQRIEHVEFRAHISELQQRTTWVEAKVNGASE